MADVKRDEKGRFAAAEEAGQVANRASFAGSGKASWPGGPREMLPSDHIKARDLHLKAHEMKKSAGFDMDMETHKENAADHDAKVKGEPLKNWATQRTKEAPVSDTHTNKQLYDASVKTGNALFGKSGSGFLTSPRKETAFSKTTMSEMKKEENGGGHVGTYEHVFFPSRPGHGVDASDQKLDFKKHADVDGKIYLHGNEGESHIRVVHPKTKK